jgi:hypothetical protein
MPGFQPVSFGARSREKLLGSETRPQPLARPWDAATGPGREDQPTRAGGGDPVVLWRNVAEGGGNAIRFLRAIGALKYRERHPQGARLNSGTR